MRRRDSRGPVCTFFALRLVVSALLLGACASMGQMVVGQNFWDMAWGGEKTNPFVTTMNEVSGSNPWKPLFLEECQPYHLLRFMDWNVTNDLEKDDKLTMHRGGWEARRKMSDSRQKPLAYEWQIDLCNRLACDYWLNIPSVVDSTYQYELAKLVKARLNPALKVYIEWSNELWNSDMTQSKVAESLGVALGFPPAGKADQQGWSYTAWRSLQCFAQFEKVFGKDSPRIVKILPSWARGTTCTRVQLDLLANPKYNPTGITADGVAIDTYFDSEKDLEERAKSWQKHKDSCTAAGIDLYFYEGGYQVGSATQTGRYALTKKGLETMQQIGFKAGAYYHHGGGSVWGCLPNLGVGLEKAKGYDKYKAVWEFCTKVPKKKLDTPIRLSPLVRANPADVKQRGVYDIRGRSLGPTRLNQRAAAALVITADEHGARLVNTLVEPLSR